MTVSEEETAGVGDSSKCGRSILRLSCSISSNLLVIIAAEQVSVGELDLDMAGAQLPTHLGSPEPVAADWPSLPYFGTECRLAPVRLSLFSLPSSGLPLAKVENEDEDEATLGRGVILTPRPPECSR